MSFANPSAEWTQLYDRYYRKVELYSSLAWGNSIDLSKLVVCGAPYGGPLAVTRDEKKILMVSQSQLRPLIQIYTCAGKKLSEFVWDKGRLVGMGWTDQEKLVCVVEDGHVLQYSVHGREASTSGSNAALGQFQLLSSREVKEQAGGGILEARIWGSGLIALTRTYQFICVANFAEPRPKLLANTSAMLGDHAPYCWTFIEPQFTLSLNVEVLVATSNTVLAVDASGVQDLVATNGPFTKITVSPNGKLLACFNEAGVLWVVPPDFSKNLTQFDTKSKVPPDQMLWCGVDSVVLYWEKIRLILMIGPYGDWIKFSYDSSSSTSGGGSEDAASSGGSGSGGSPVFLVPECDGVRIISNEKCEFLHRVPDSTESIFKIGSTAPAAMLYDALDHFEKKSPKADENIRSIQGPELSLAVSACIDAAGHEFNDSLQRSLLKAASFGKCFLDGPGAGAGAGAGASTAATSDGSASAAGGGGIRSLGQSAAFVDMCKSLRVLNAVRHYDVGIPITFQQYKQLGAEGLIERLINHHHHLLAYKVCDYLKLRKDKVLVHWACVKVASPNSTDSEILDAIVEKLQDVPGISYAEIASTAYRHGRTELATQLLDYEPRAADQVPLLISMQQDELALLKAIDSGDTDLVYLVVLHIKRNLTLPEFFRIIRNKPVALDLLISYCKQQNDFRLLREVYLGMDRPTEVANILILDSYHEKDLDRRVSKLQEAMNIFAGAKDTFSQKTTEDQLRLLLLQKDLETSLEGGAGSTGGKWIDLSLSETLYQLVVLGQSKRAAKVKTDFKIPDKRYWWIKIKGHVQVRDWASLEKFAKEKKSPIGYHPFADECIRAGNMTEALKYIQKIQEVPLRTQYYMDTGNYLEAAETAKSMKDLTLLNTIRNKVTGANSSRIVQQIDQMISQLGQK